MRPISRILALVLAALLALSIPCLAETSFGSFTADQYTSFAVVGNMLYAADTLNDSLWRYDNAGGSSSYETGRDTEIIALASCDGRLYSLESRMIPKPPPLFEGHSWPSTFLSCGIFSASIKTLTLLTLTPWNW